MSPGAKPSARRLVRVLIIDDSAFVRRTLRNRAELGDTTTLADPSVVQSLMQHR